MEPLIHGKNVKITPQFRAHAEERVEGLQRFFSRILKVHVSVKRHRGQYSAELMANASGMLLRAEEQRPDMHVAFDDAVDKLERRLRRFKGRLYHHSRGTIRKQLPPEEPTEAEEADEQEPEIVRTKQISMKPMSPEEAALQMEMLHHDFFVFTSDETDEVNVIYRRRDGNYGLIEPAR
ncbi:MAG: ribosome-associated translation inhibitor RaiA [Armatimonadota bacterium]|jgi:putative sigma-54 modulation protein